MLRVSPLRVLGVVLQVEKSNGRGGRQNQGFDRRAKYPPIIPQRPSSTVKVLYSVSPSQPQEITQERQKTRGLFTENRRIHDHFRHDHSESGTEPRQSRTLTGNRPNQGTDVDGRRFGSRDGVNERSDNRTVR